MNRSFIALFLVILTFSSQLTIASELNSKLDRTAARLLAAAEAKNILPATLAIFPFQADKKLSAKRVNFAVSEILTKRLLTKAGFTILERTQIEEIMKEQRLGLSGALDSKTAAGIGKIAGAKLLVLGSVSQLGKYYQITAKLVAAESGEIIASEISEVDVSVFDEDADRYLVLVPRSEAIGLYLATGFGPARVRNLGPVEYNPGKELIPKNHTTNLLYTGVGIRYLLSANWLADCAVMVSSKYDNNNRIVAYTQTQEISGGGISGTMARAFAIRLIPVSSHFKAQVGGGITVLDAESAKKSDSEEWLEILGNPMYAVNVRTEAKTAVLPTLKLGLEWKPRPRLGWSVSGLYYFGKMTARTAVQNSTTVPKTYIQEFDSPAFTIETTLSLYF